MEVGERHDVLALALARTAQTRRVLDLCVDEAEAGGFSIVVAEYDVRAASLLKRSRAMAREIVLCSVAMLALLSMRAQISRIIALLLAAAIVFIVIAPSVDLPSTVKTQSTPLLPWAVLMVEFVFTLGLPGNAFCRGSWLQRCGSRLEVEDLTCARLC